MLFPGLAVVVVAVAMSGAAGSLVPVVSPLVVGVVLGIGWRAWLGSRPGFLPGQRFAATWLLRIGVMLLGLRLAVSDVVQFGPAVLAVVLVSVAGAFVGTLWFGRRLDAPRRLLLATGVSICGASAVAAVNPVADGDEDDVATAVTSVSLLGTLAIGVVPVLAWLFGLSDTEFGVLTGATVHEVGQVVAIGGAAGALVLQVAVVIKLARVVLLAPLVIGLGAIRRRSVAQSPEGGLQGISRNKGHLQRVSRNKGHLQGGAARPPLVPWFVAGFVLLVVVRTLEVVPAPVLSVSQTAANLLLAAGMFGIGAAVDLRAVVRSGGRALAVAGMGSVLLIVLAGGGILLVS